MSYIKKGYTLHVNTVDGEQNEQENVYCGLTENKVKEYIGVFQSLTIEEFAGEDSNDEVIEKKFIKKIGKELYNKLILDNMIYYEELEGGDWEEEPYRELVSMYVYYYPEDVVDVTDQFLPQNNYI